jgi:hypothetical protein
VLILQSFPMPQTILHRHPITLFIVLFITLVRQTFQASCQRTCMRLLFTTRSLTHCPDKLEAVWEDKGEPCPHAIHGNSGPDCLCQCRASCNIDRIYQFTYYSFLGAPRNVRERCMMRMWHELSPSIRIFYVVLYGVYSIWNMSMC